MSIRQRGKFSVIQGPAWPGISYFCSTRIGGVSNAPWGSLNVGLHTGDNPMHVQENRRLIAPPDRPVIWLDQVHGTDVFDADGDDAGSTVVQADASVTTRTDRVLAIMVADCLPVVLGSADGQVAGVAHAGWRGLSSGVLENTLGALQARHVGKEAPIWRAWIGPGISQDCFEVGDEVRRCFTDADSDTSRFFRRNERGKWQADLSGIARHRLVKAGVGRIDVATFCTYKRRDLLFSYRRDGVTGRQVAFVWRNM